MISEPNSALPLVLATLLLVISIAASRFRARSPLGLYLVWRLAAFAGLTILVQWQLGSPLRPRYSASYSGTDFWEHVVEACWWLFAASAGVNLMRLFVVLEHRPRETQIVSDLMAGAIYIATLLAIVNFVFGVPIAGLLATSGVIAIVLGLALQNTLADVFSGIAVGIERPYKAGDLLWVEGDIEGHVTQVTWRSTHIATFQSNIAIVPNSVIAKARLVNRSLPEPIRGDTIAVKLDPAASPERCIAALLAAARASLLPLASRTPTVSCTGIQGDGASYEVSYSVATSGVLGAARTDILSEIHRHLRHAGIALAVPGTSIRASAAAPTVVDILQQSDLFGSLQPEERNMLAKHFEEVELSEGEALFHEGDIPKFLFLVAEGVVEITTTGASGPRIVARMSPGESLGAIGLICGTPYSATAKALTQLRLFRLDKTAIGAAMAAAPQLAAGLEALAERSRAVLARDAAAHPDDPHVQPDELRSTLRRFLKFVDSHAAPLISRTR
jgi:small-conductance mechanosensitive channel